jgi:hypothetical protein
MEWVCPLVEPFPALLLWKRDVFLHFWKCPISPINYYFYCNHPSIIWVTNCIIAPTLPNCSDFETTKMLFWKYRSKKNKRVCSTPLTDLLCLHIWLPDMLLFKAVVSHSKAVLSLIACYGCLFDLPLLYAIYFPVFSTSAYSLTTYHQILYVKGGGTSGLNAR